MDKQKYSKNLNLEVHDFNVYFLGIYSKNQAIKLN